MDKLLSFAPAAPVAKTTRPARQADPAVDTALDIFGVQIRLMGPNTEMVKAAARKLAESGLIRITGAVANRGPGMRVYGSVSVD
jgi:hypothetical protein